MPGPTASKIIEEKDAFENFYQGRIQQKHQDDFGNPPNNIIQ